MKRWGLYEYSFVTGRRKLGRTFRFRTVAEMVNLFGHAGTAKVKRLPEPGLKSWRFNATTADRGARSRTVIAYETHVHPTPRDPILAMADRVVDEWIMYGKTALTPRHWLADPHEARPGSRTWCAPSADPMLEEAHRRLDAAWMRAKYEGKLGPHVHVDVKVRTKPDPAPLAWNGKAYVTAKGREYGHWTC